LLHREWVDEALSMLTPSFRIMTRFLALVPDLITHTVEAARSKQID